MPLDKRIDLLVDYAKIDSIMHDVSRRVTDMGWGYIGIKVLDSNDVVWTIVPTSERNDSPGT